MSDKFEQKPKQWALFPMSDEDIQKKEDFFHDKGWDLDKVPTYSGKLTLPDGTIVRLEARMVEGSRGDFFVGSCYIPTGQGGGSGRDDRRETRDRGGDTRTSGSRDRGEDRGRERTRERDDRSRGRDYGDRSRTSNRAAFDNDLDDDVPF